MVRFPVLFNYTIKQEVIEKLQQEGRIDRENKMVAEKKMKELAGHYHEISLEVESSKQQIKKCMTWIRELSETGTCHAF